MQAERLARAALPALGRESWSPVRRRSRFARPRRPRARAPPCSPGRARRRSATHRLEVESPAVVGDRQLDVLARSRRARPSSRFGVAMDDPVSERLLRDSEETHTARRAARSPKSPALNPHLDALCRFSTSAQCAFSAVARPSSRSVAGANRARDAEVLRRRPERLVLELRQRLLGSRILNVTR